MEIQYYGKIICNFLQIGLAKNTPSFRHHSAIMKTPNIGGFKSLPDALIPLKVFNKTKQPPPYQQLPLPIWAAS